MCLTTENFKDNKNKIIQYTSPSSFVIQQWKLDYYSKRCKKNNSSGDEIYIYKKKKQWDTLRQIIKQRDCKGMKHNPSFGHNTGLEEKLDMTCKQNPS